MNEKYYKILENLNSLKKDLSNPEIIVDQNKLIELSKKFNEMGPVGEKIEKIIDIERRINEAQLALKEEKDTELLAVAADEVSSLSEKLKKLIASIDNDLQPKDPLDNKNIVMEIRAGTGGDESALFAADLFRMYSRYAEKKGYKVKILSDNKTGIGGFKEIIFEIIGHQVYKNLKYESGVHRVQRVPETEKSGRVHTSAATVAVLPEADEVDIAVKSEDLKIDVFRAGGCGGQSVNTTDSAVRITHLPTGIIVACQDERSQVQNKAKAMQILRSRLLAAQEEKKMKELGEKRKSQIGTGDRSEKIRTYNFPQDRLTDHRVKQNWHNLSQIMDGEIQPIIDFIDQEEKRLST